MALHFHDNQIRRYLTQLIRMFSNFSVRENDGKIRAIPVTYGDMARQVANIIRENSENKLPSVPRMSVYITNLEVDRNRTSDSSFVSKVNIRERAFDQNNREYLNKQGKNYTVERLMPVPYNLTINVDIWTSNTDQKLQVLEQLLMIFNPSLELQTTDNFVDWTSITTVELTNINYSSRSIPVGTESEIDIATLTFVTPIYISPPTKVKRLGVITNIITSVFNEQTGSIELGLSRPQTGDSGLYNSASIKITEERNLVNTDGEKERVVDYGEFPNVGTGEMDIEVTRRLTSTVGDGSIINTSWLNLGLYIIDRRAFIVDQNTIGKFLWRDYFESVSFGDCFKPGLTQIRLTLSDGTVVIGYIRIDPTDENALIIEWDPDTLPASSVFEGPARDPNSWSSLDFIIDPLRWNPNQAKTPGLRLMLLSKIGNEINQDGADGWKNADGSEFVAGENDIVEWDGSRWHIIFDADSASEVKYITNLKTGVQYRWTGEFWTKSFEGEYPSGAWQILPEG